MVDEAEEALRQLGLIAIGAAAAEMNLARMASHASDHLSLREALRLSNKDKLRQIRSGLAFRRNMMGTERTDRRRRELAILWAEDAIELLRRRGVLMHSEWILARAVANHQAPKLLLQHHLSTGTRLPVNSVELGELALRFEECNLRYRKVELAAWKIGAETFTHETFPD